jgi:hypothetical protein
MCNSLFVSYKISSTILFPLHFTTPLAWGFRRVIINPILFEGSLLSAGYRGGRNKE